MGSLCRYFGTSLGSVWVSVGDFGSLDGRFVMIVKSLWVYEGPLSKKTHFPTDLNDFIKLRSVLWTTLGHFRITFGY